MSSFYSPSYADDNYYNADQNELSSFNIPAIVPLGDSGSNLSILNSTSSSVVITGLIIDRYNCTNNTCSNGCTNVTNSKVVLWNRVTIPAGNTMTVGQNYLYNLLTILNNAANSSTTSPCAGVTSTRYIHISTTSTTPQGNSSFTANGGACILFTAANCINSLATWNPSATVITI